MAATSLHGTYIGRNRVRPGREDELSPTERKQLEKAATVDLVLGADGTFKKQITEGTWVSKSDRVVFSPTRFGGKTEEEMRLAAEEMGRSFGLRFVFFDFELLVKDDVLVTPDESAVIFTEFSRA